MCSAYTASNIDASTTSGRSVATGEDATAAVATATRAHAATPPAKMQTRAVPRSRIVARRALYSCCSRTVMVWAAGTDRPERRAGPAGRRIVAQDLGKAGVDETLPYKDFDSSAP